MCISAAGLFVFFNSLGHSHPIKILPFLLSTKFSTRHFTSSSLALLALSHSRLVTCPWEKEINRLPRQELEEPYWDSIFVGCASHIFKETACSTLLFTWVLTLPSHTWGAGPGFHWSHTSISSIESVVVKKLKPSNGSDVADNMGREDMEWGSERRKRERIWWERGKEEKG